MYDSYKTFGLETLVINNLNTKSCMQKEIEWAMLEVKNLKRQDVTREIYGRTKITDIMKCIAGLKWQWVGQI